MRRVEPFSSENWEVHLGKPEMTTAENEWSICSRLGRWTTAIQWTLRLIVTHLHDEGVHDVSVRILCCYILFC